MTACTGRGEPDGGHCCWLGRAGECPHVIGPSESGRRWSCGLMAELGSWEAVYADPRYALVDEALADYGFRCGDWEPTSTTVDQCCARAEHETAVSL